MLYPLLTVFVILVVLIVLYAKDGESHKERIIRRNEQTYPTRAAAPAHKEGMYGLAVVAFLLAALSLFTANPLLIGVGVVLCFAGAWCIRIGMTADQRERDNVRARAEAKQYDAQHEAATVALEQARDAARLQMLLAEKAAETAILQQGLQQQQIAQQHRELQLRGRYVEAAGQWGVGVDQYMEVNTKRLLDDLENKKKWDEIQNDLRAGSQLLLATNQDIKELYRDLEEVVDRLVKVEGSDKPEFAKELLRKPLRSQIESLTGQIDGIQARLHISEGRQAPKGITSAASNSRRGYPSETSGDAI